MQNTRLPPNGGFAKVYAISANGGSWPVSAKRAALRKWAFVA
jgi:hypothetical protein